MSAAPNAASARLDAVRAFNARVAQASGEPASAHRATFPDFDAMALAAKRELAARRADSEARGRAAVERSHVPRTAAEYRGAGAVRLEPPHKNQSTKASELSAPIAERRPDHLVRLAAENRLGLKTSDVSLAEIDARITGRGSLFAAANCRTSPGWKPGCFAM
jgi:hypothetical protein